MHFREDLQAPKFCFRVGVKSINAESNDLQATIKRHCVGVKSQTKPTNPICKEESLLSSRVAVGLQHCFDEFCICNNLEKRGARPLHFQRLFSTFVEDIQNTEV